MKIMIKTLAVCAWAAATAVAFADGEVSTPFPEGKKAAIAFTFDDVCLRCSLKGLCYSTSRVRDYAQHAKTL